MSVVGAERVGIGRSSWLLSEDAAGLPLAPQRRHARARAHTQRTLSAGMLSAVTAPERLATGPYAVGPAATSITRYSLEESL